MSRHPLSPSLTSPTAPMELLDSIAAANSRVQELTSRLDAHSTDTRQVVSDLVAFVDLRRTFVLIQHRGFWEVAGKCGLDRMLSGLIISNAPDSLVRSSILHSLHAPNGMPPPTT